MDVTVTTMVKVVHKQSHLVTMMLQGRIVTEKVAHILQLTCVPALQLGSQYVPALQCTKLCTLLYYGIQPLPAPHSREKKRCSQIVSHNQGDRVYTNRVSAM